MRGIIGLILAGLGAFLILVAVLLPTWVVGQALKFPLSESETATLEASNASYFSVASLRERTGVTLRATYTITGDASAGNSSTAVWNQTSDVYDVTNHAQVQQMTRRFAFNRRTGQLVDCCGASVNGDKTVRQTGLVGYVFPMGTQKQTYQVFDTTLKKTMPFVYSGTANVDGIQAYEFVENVPPTQIGSVTLPGSFVKMAAASVTLGTTKARWMTPSLSRAPARSTPVSFRSPRSTSAPMPVTAWAEASERASRQFRGELRVERIAFGHSDTGARVRICK